jgi:aspartate beta-hydroxylase
LDIQGTDGVDIVLIVYPTNYDHIFLSAAPTLEVFFARQDGKTGIKSHTDNANFIQTTHLGIDVPEGECWIKVGEHTREWMNGKIIICDTSFMHETENESENDRYVLIMRHWHPEVTAIEKIANEFLFAALDNGTDTGLVAAQKHALRKIKGLRSASSSAASNGGGGGFGGGSLKKKPGQKKKRK